MNATATPKGGAWPDEPHPGGRPTKFNPPALKRILGCARRGMPLTLVAKAVGVSEMGLRNFRKGNPRFEAALQRAIARGVDSRLRKIEQAAETSDWRTARRSRRGFKSTCPRKTTAW
jgi:hypothetical protein